MRRLFILTMLLILFFFIFPVTAQFYTALNFLTINTHPLAVGQGAAGTANLHGIKGAFYNPALINGTQHWEIYYNRIVFQKPYFFKGFTLYSTGAAYRINDHQVVGFRFQRVGFGENILTDTQGNLIRKESSYDYALTFVYGHQFSGNFTTGLSFKYLYSKHFVARIDNPIAIAKSWALDVGILKKNLFPFLTLSFPNVTITGWDFFKPVQEERGLSLGIALLNAGPHIWYIDPSQKDPIPQTFRVGIAYTIMSAPVFQLQGVFDFEKLLVHRELVIPDAFYKAWFTAWKGKPFKEAIYHFGANFQLLYILNLALGYQYQPLFPDQSRFTMGIGLNLKYFSIQYGKWLTQEDSSPFYRHTYLFSVQLQDIRF